MGSLHILQAASAIALVLCLRHFTRVYTRRSAWKNIPGPPSESFLTGHLALFFDPFSWPFHLELPTKYRGIMNITGIFGDQQLYISDPFTMQRVVSKDPDVYETNDLFIDISRLLFGLGLSGTVGKQHRQQRKMVQPLFNMNQMRRMTPTFYEIVHELLVAKIEAGLYDVDVDVMTRAAIELIGRNGLDYSFSAFQDGKTNLFAEALESVVPSLGPLGPVAPMIPWLVKIGPKGLRRFIVSMIPNQHVQRLKHAVDTIEATSRKIYQDKLDAICKGGDELEKEGRDRDIMSVLLKANLHSSAGNRLSEEELIGQVSLLVFAAMDTTSFGLARTFSLLAEHLDIQDRLREEVQCARRHGDISWDELDKLPFLDAAVVRETLRLYPPLSFITRVARQDSVLPVSLSDGAGDTMFQTVMVPAGSNLMLSILGANRAKGIWGDDAEEWRPERWLGPALHTTDKLRVPGIYSNLMTFSDGHRSCVGYNFAVMEMKVILSVLLEVLSFSLSEKQTYWRFARIVPPSIEGRELTQAKPELPMKVAFAIP